MTHGLIAHATNSETGSILGQHDGDQLGCELCACKWYDGEWLAVYRAKTEEARERMARFAEDAVTNGYIGYSQDNEKRHAFITAVMNNDYQPEMVNENCTCDCSTLVYGAVCAYYAIPWDSGLGLDGSVPTTGNFDSFLMERVADFDKHTTDDYLKAATLLQRGDILLKDGHIAIWI